MKLNVNYVNDNSGTLRAVQLPLAEWKKLLARIHKYEQALQIQSELQTAFNEVKRMRSGKLKKKTLSSFLHEL